jgi:transposase-like protein
MSMAAMAMARGINASLLRRWVRDAEGNPGASEGGVAALSAPPVPARSEFVALKVQDHEVQPDIRSSCVGER